MCARSRPGRLYLPWLQEPRCADLSEEMRACLPSPVAAEWLTLIQQVRTREVDMLAPHRAARVSGYAPPDKSNRGNRCPQTVCSSRPPSLPAGMDQD